MKTKASRQGALLQSVLLFSVFLLSLNSIHDTDAWLHLSMGRLIWETGGLPGHEMFSYPSLEMPFSYSSWLFGAASYAAYLLLGAPGLVLLKAALATVIFHFLLRDSLRPYGELALSALVLGAAALVVQVRFVLRPDILAMAALSYCIFALNAYLYEKKKYIYAIPLVAVIWANSHSSINLVFLVFGAFAAGGAVHLFLERKSPLGGWAPSASEIRTILMVFLVSFGASLISPYFMAQYFHGQQYLVTDWYKQEIAELRPPAGHVRALAVTITALLASSFLVGERRFLAIRVLLVAPFVILTFVSARFIFYLTVIGSPVFIRNLSAFIEARGWAASFRSKAAGAAAGVLVGAGAALALAGVPYFGQPANSFGLGFDLSRMPAGAVSYMEKNGITGRVLNSFGFGQYIIWTGYPGRTVFMDARGYVPVGLLEKSERFSSSSKTLDELYEKFGFDSILIGQVQPGGLLDKTLSHPGWALVHWDDTSLLYLRRGGKYQRVIDADEYRAFNPGMPFDLFRKRLADPDWAGAAEAELKRNERETGSSLSPLWLGALYGSTGRHREAIEALEMARPRLSRDFHYTLEVLTGDSYREMGDAASALAHYETALEQEANASILYKAGALHASIGEDEKAVGYLEESVRLEPENFDAYPLLVHLYQKAGRPGEAEKARRQYSAQKAAATAKRHFEDGLKAYSEKDYARAAVEFKKSIELNPAAPAAYSNLAYVYYDMGEYALARGLHEKALSLDPGNALSHYGLALEYKRSGDRRAAIEHFRKYLDAEPEGYFARKAKKEIAGLDGPVR